MTAGAERYPIPRRCFRGKSSVRGKAEGRYTIWSDLGVLGAEQLAFDIGLRDEHPVEWVAVMRRQLCRILGVFTVGLQFPRPLRRARRLRDTIDADRYPLSPRVQMWKGILAKIRPEAKPEPLPPLKTL